MKEIWRDVIGYEGLFQVSNLGRVRGLDRQMPITRYGKTHYRSVPGIVLNPHVSKGYGTVYLRNGLLKRRIEKVHRIVAKAFIPNPENKTYINHIDSNRLNNRIDNLEWCTAQENSDHCKRVGRSTFGDRNGRCKLTEKQVLEIRAKYISGISRANRGYSQLMLAQEYSVTKTLIRYILQRKLWGHI